MILEKQFHRTNHAKGHEEKAWQALFTEWVSQCHRFFVPLR